MFVVAVDDNQSEEFIGGVFHLVFHHALQVTQLTSNTASQYLPLVLLCLS